MPTALCTVSLTLAAISLAESSIDVACFSADAWAALTIEPACAAVFEAFFFADFTTLAMLFSADFRLRSALRRARFADGGNLLTAFLTAARVRAGAFLAAALTAAAVYRLWEVPANEI